MTLYAYIMTHDTGDAPNPSREVCTLAYCMPMTRGKAQEGDYVVGLRGRRLGSREYLKKVGGDWHIIYAMKVTETLTLSEHAKRFPARPGPQVKTDRALVSNDFAYWGKEAKKLPDSLQFLRQAFYSNSVLSGISHRCGFSDEEVQAFKRWFNKQKKGRQGEPFEYAGPRRKC